MEKGTGRKAIAPTRVLICEDEGLTVLRFQKTLAAMGYDVVGEAKDGEAAVAQAQRLHPDVILMDVHMPKLDGIQATGRVMALCPTAIVMVTAYSDQELVQRALEAGASGYLVKPVQEEQLRPAISVALTRFAELRELGSEVTDLKEALEARKMIERAKGILVQRRGYNEEEAFRQMQRVSRERRQTMKETAQQIIAAAELL
jgi:two-component system, response regulator PdtaR